MQSHQQTDTSKAHNFHVTPNACNFTDKHESLDLSLSEEKDHNNIKRDQQLVIVVHLHTVKIAAGISNAQTQNIFVGTEGWLHTTSENRRAHTFVNLKQIPVVSAFALAVST